MSLKRKIGSVKVRHSSSRVEKSSLEVTIPKMCTILLNVKAGDIMDVFIDEKEGEIIYRLKA